MKRCLSPTASPPSSPIISRTKRVEVQKKEDSFDEDAQELTISKEETEINRTEHNTNIQSGVKFFSLTSFFVEERREKYLSIGCPLLDRSLSGGVRTGELTEVVGESSSGKTQFCLQLSVQAALRGEKVAYIATEGAFPSSRLDQMVSTKKKPELRDFILIQQIRNVQHLITVLSKDLEELLKTDTSVSCVVIDSVAACVRYDADQTTGLERASLIHKLGQLTLNIALKHKVAVVAVNQVTDDVGERLNAAFKHGRKQLACLGHAWSQYPHTRLWLTKTKLVTRDKSGIRLRTLSVDWSCRLKSRITYWYVDTSGCHGVNIID